MSESNMDSLLSVFDSALGSLIVSNEHRAEYCTAEVHMLRCS
jgi:hypothetical protein